MKRLNEEFKSEKLRKLTTFFPPKISWSSIAQAFKIEVDQITDDQVQVVPGPKAYKLLKNNQNLMGFFIFTGNNNLSRGLMGIKLGSKFVKLSNSNHPLYSTRDPDKNDPKYIRKGFRKSAYLDKDSGIRNTTGKANKNQDYIFSGRNGSVVYASGFFTAGDFWSDDVIVYILDTTMSSNSPAEKFTDRQQNRMPVETMKDIKANNLYRYKAELAKIRELKDPEFVADLKTILDDLSKTVINITTLVTQNASKFRYNSVDKEISYGSGRNYLKYTTSFLKMIVEAYSNFDDIVKEYKSGSLKYSNFEKIKQTYEYIKIQRIKEDIENLAIKIQNTIDK